MTVHLLDTSVLIALFWPSSIHHAAAARWFKQHRSSGWATCPFTEAGFVRIISNPAFSRDAVTPLEAVHLLAVNTSAKDHVFWPDALPVPGALGFAGSRLAGHRQITDAYLLGLAIHQGASFATLDSGIRMLAASASSHRNRIVLIEAS